MEEGEVIGDYIVSTLPARSTATFAPTGPRQRYQGYGVVVS